MPKSIHIYKSFRYTIKYPFTQNIPIYSIVFMYTKYPNTLIHRLAQSLIGKLIKVIASLVSNGT